MATVDRLANQDAQVCALPEAVVERHGRYRIGWLPAIRSMPTGSRVDDPAIERGRDGFCSALGEILHRLVYGDRGIGNLEGQGFAVRVRECSPGRACDLLRDHCADPTGGIPGASHAEALRNRIVEHVAAGQILLRYRTASADDRASHFILIESHHRSTGCGIVLKPDLLMATVLNAQLAPIFREHRSKSVAVGD